METEIMTLLIELKTSKNDECLFNFSKTMLHAVQSELSIIYSEVFIWSCGNNLGVWVVGNDLEPLFGTFIHYETHFEKVHILDQKYSIFLLEDIAAGKSWTECDMKTRMTSLQFGYFLSKELDSFGDELLPLIKKGMNTLWNLNSIGGGNNKNKINRNDSATKREDTVKIAYNAFHNFSFN